MSDDTLIRIREALAEYELQGTKLSEILLIWFLDSEKAQSHVHDALDKLARTVADVVDGDVHKLNIQVAELAMLTRQLIIAVERHTPGQRWARKAREYLSKNDLNLVCR